MDFSLFPISINIKLDDEIDIVYRFNTNKSFEIWNIIKNYEEI
jgi:hypothetical protein